MSEFNAMSCVTNQIPETIELMKEISLELSSISKEVSELRNDISWIKSNLYVNKSCKYNSNGDKKKVKASITGISSPTGANDVKTKGNKGSYASNTGTNEKAGHIKVRNNKTGEEKDIDVYAKDGEQNKEAMLRVKHDWSHDGWTVLTNMVQPPNPDTAEQGPEEKPESLAEAYILPDSVDLPEGGDKYGDKVDEEVLVMDAETMADRVSAPVPSIPEIVKNAGELAYKLYSGHEEPVNLGGTTTVGPGNSVEAILVPIAEQSIEDEVGSSHDADVWNIANMNIPAEEKEKLMRESDLKHADLFHGLGTRIGDIASANLYTRPSVAPNFYDWKNGTQVNFKSGLFERFSQDDAGNWQRIPTDENGNDIVEEVEEVREAVEEEEQGEENEEEVEREQIGVPIGGGVSSGFSGVEGMPAEPDFNLPGLSDYMKIRNAAANQIMNTKGESMLYRPLTCLLLRCCNAIEHPDQDYDVEINISLRDVASRLGLPGWRGLANDFTNKVYGYPSESEHPFDSINYDRKIGKPKKLEISAPGRDSFGVTVDDGASIPELLNRIAKVQKIPHSTLSGMRLCRDDVPVFDREQSVGTMGEGRLDLKPIVAGGSNSGTHFVEGDFGKKTPILYGFDEPLSGLYHVIQDQLCYPGDFHITVSGHTIHKNERRSMREMNIEKESNIKVLYRLRGGGDVNTEVPNLDEPEAIEAKGALSAKAEKLMEEYGIKRSINNIGANTLTEINHQEDTWGFKTNISEGMGLTVSQELRGNSINAGKAVNLPVSGEGPVRFQEYTATGLGGQVTICDENEGDNDRLARCVQTINEGTRVISAANSNDDARKGRDVIAAGAHAAFEKTIYSNSETLPGSDLYQMSRDGNNKMANSFAWNFFSMNRANPDKKFTGIEPIRRAFEGMAECLSKSSGADFQVGLVMPNTDGRTHWKGLEGQNSYPAFKPICPSGMMKPPIGNFSGVPDQLILGAGIANRATAMPSQELDEESKDKFFAESGSKHAPRMTYGIWGNEVMEGTDANDDPVMTTRTRTDINSYVAGNWLPIVDARTGWELDAEDVHMPETCICTQAEFAAMCDPNSGVTFKVDEFGDWDYRKADDVLPVPVTPELEAVAGGTNHQFMAYLSCLLPRIAERTYPNYVPDVDGGATVVIETTNEQCSDNFEVEDVGGERDTSGISFMRTSIGEVHKGMKRWKKLIFVTPDKHFTWGTTTKQINTGTVDDNDNAIFFTATGTDYGANKPVTFECRVRAFDTTFPGYRVGTSVDETHRQRTADSFTARNIALNNALDPTTFGGGLYRNHTYRGAIDPADGMRTMIRDARDIYRSNPGERGYEAYTDGEWFMKLSTAKNSPADISNLAAQPIDWEFEEQVPNDLLLYGLVHWYSQDGNTIAKDYGRAREIMIDQFKPTALELTSMHALLADIYAGRQAPMTQGGTQTIVDPQTEDTTATMPYQESGGDLVDESASIACGSVPQYHNYYYSTKSGYVDEDPNLVRITAEQASERPNARDFTHLNSLGLLPAGLQMGARPSARIIARVPGNKGSFVDSTGSTHRSYGFGLQTTQWAQNSTLLTATLRQPVNIGLVNHYKHRWEKRAWGYEENPDDQDNPIPDNSGTHTTRNSGAPVSLQSIAGLYGPTGITKQGTDFTVPHYEPGNAVFVAHNSMEFGTRSQSGTTVEFDKVSALGVEDAKVVKFFRDVAPSNYVTALRKDNEIMHLVADQTVADKGGMSVSKLCSGPLIPEHQNWIGISEKFTNNGEKGGVFFPFNQDANPNEAFRGKLISTLRAPIVERFNPGNNKGSPYRFTVRPPPQRYNPGFLTLNHPDIGPRSEMQLLEEMTRMYQDTYPPSRPVPYPAGGLLFPICDDQVGAYIAINISGLNHAGAGGVNEAWKKKPNYGFSCPTILSGDAWDANYASIGSVEAYQLFGEPLGSLQTGYQYFKDNGGAMPNELMLNWETTTPKKLWNTQAQAPFNVLPFNRIAPVVRAIKSGTDYGGLSSLCITNDNRETTLAGTNSKNHKVKMFTAEGINDTDNGARQLFSTTFRTFNTPTAGIKVENNVKQILHAAGANGAPTATLVQEGAVAPVSFWGVPTRRPNLDVAVSSCEKFVPATVLTIDKTAQPKESRIAPEEYWSTPSTYEVTINNRGLDVNMPPSAFSLTQAARTPFLPPHNNWLKKLSTAYPIELVAQSWDGTAQGGAGGPVEWHQPDYNLYSLEKQVAPNPELTEFLQPTGVDTVHLGVSRNTPNRVGCDIMLMSNRLIGMTELAQKKQEVIGTPQVYTGGATEVLTDFTYDENAVTEADAFAEFGLDSNSGE